MQGKLLGEKTVAKLGRNKKDQPAPSTMGNRFQREQSLLNAGEDSEFDPGKNVRKDIGGSPSIDVCRILEKDESRAANQGLAAWASFPEDLRRLC